jgi:hypothetical protein
MNFVNKDVTTATALTACGSNLRWYTTPTGGTGSNTAPTPSTATVGTTNHYVSQTVNGCESPRAQITVNVQAPQTWYADVDGDGYGDINQPIQACVRPMGYVSNGLDRCPTDAAKVEPGLVDVIGVRHRV